MSLAQALRDLGLAMNGVIPSGTRIADIIKSIGETYSGKPINVTGIANIIDAFADNLE